MIYEEIAKIKDEPFRDKTLENIYYGGYRNCFIMPWLYALLFFHYYEKFDKIYGTHLTGQVDIPNRLVDKDADTEIEDWDFDLWTNEVPTLLMNAFSEGGWVVNWVSMAENPASAPSYCEESEKERREVFHKDYEALLDEDMEDCHIKTAFQMEEATMYDALRNLEDVEMGIFWNPRLSEYMAFRKSRKDVIEAACPKEDFSIMLLEKHIWEPYMVFWTEGKREMDGWEYGFVVLGNDGYGWTDTSTINPNWIGKAMKLKFLLDRANEKILRYLDQEKRFLEE